MQNLLSDSMDMATLLQHVSSLNRGRVLVIGDIMLDTYLIGDTQRISPEAPIPVVQVEEKRHLLGGAGNVARNITALGGQASLLGVIGSDSEGRLIKQMLEEAQVEPLLVTSPWRPTTVKTRVLARNQQMIRLDQENGQKLQEQEQAHLAEYLQQYVGQFDAIIISDYCKGVVTPDLITAIQAASSSLALQLPILVDPKPQHKPFYAGAYLITPNAKETSESTGLPVSTREEIILAGQRLLEEANVEHVLATLGAGGMALFDDHGSIVHIATTARQVFDVTGAGDTVIASLALGIAAGLNLLEACILANYAAGVVVGKVGAATASSEELRTALNTIPLDIERWA